MTKEERLEYMRHRFPALKKIHAAGKSVVASVKEETKITIDTEAANTLETFREYLKENRAERDILTSDEI